MIGWALGGLLLVATLAAGTVPAARAAPTGASFVTDMRDQHAPLLCRMFPSVQACLQFCAGYTTTHKNGHCDCLAPNCLGPDGKPLPAG